MISASDPSVISSVVRPPVTGGTETILVIEDDEWVRLIATRAMRRAGYTVLDACDGASALLVSEGHAGTIDLVLCDAIMPGLSPGAVVQQISRARPNLRAVFMSGYSSDVVARHGLDAGAVAFLGKPFTPHQLLTCVRVQLDLQRSAPEPTPSETDVIARPARLAALRATGLLDSPREEAFDRLTRLATRFLNVPAAFISLVDERRDFYLSASGFGEPLASARELNGVTFCHYTIRSAAPLVIPDTAGDPLYRTVPTVTSPGVAAYVGIPMVVHGEAIGAMCVIDSAPHSWSAADVQVLSDLAAVALDCIELRAATRSQADARVAIGHANAQLLLAKNAAEQANRAKAEFLANVSHELRTPLNSIIGFANVLRRNTARALSERELKYLDRIGFNGTQMLALVDRILDLARIEQGSLQLRCAWVDVADAARTVCDSLEDQAAAAGVSLTAHDDGPPGPVAEATQLHTDASKLNQLLMNLAGNAVKFTPVGGSVRVVLHRDPSGAPRRVDVSDTGIGIAPDAQARIFEPFEQAETDTGARFGGSGLGLAISQALCAALGFTLTLASDVGVGSTFSIGFPS